MGNQPADTYLKNKVMTASPEQLRLMLYDGAMKFCRQAQHATVQNDCEGMYHALLRAQKIVLELMNSLNHEVDPDLCDKMTALYSYIYRRLVDASLERDDQVIGECLNLIEYERQTWMMLMDKLQKIRAEGGDSVSEAKDQWASRQAEAPLASIGPAAPQVSDGDEPQTRISIEG